MFQKNTNVKKIYRPILNKIKHIRNSYMYSYREKSEFSQVKALNYQMGSSKIQDLARKL